jgi:hypothetical protein
MYSGNIFRATIIFVIGSSLALFLGIGIVTDQTQTLLQFVAVAFCLLCILLGTKVWLLIGMLGALNFPLIRGLDTGQLGQMTFLVFGTMLLMMRRLPVRFTMGEIEWWRLAIGLCIAQVYIRNPVGLNMFGAGNVGGKAYFIAALAFITSWLYGSLIVPARELKWAMKLHLFCSAIGIPISEIRTRSGLAAIEASEVGAQQTASDEGAATRVGFLGGIAVVLSRWIASRVNPIRACFHPIWGPLILITLAAAAGSGYRNTIAIVGLTYLVALCYRGGLPSVLLSFVIGAFGIGMLSFINVIAPLPPNMQRSLTAFPGTWEQRYKDDAKGSSEWRYEMWREALLTDNWIDNKWFGDGLGMSAKEFERSTNLDSRKIDRGISGITVHQENAMASGDYHSGPVQTVRIVGYFGLVILLAAMIRNAVHAHRLIIRCKGTDWQILSLYYGIPVIVTPFMFTFVFGDFEKGAVGVFMSGAFLQVINRSIPLPPYTKPKRQPYILQRNGAQKTLPASRS